MTSLFSARRRAEEFADALDGPTAPREELLPYVTLATRLRSHAPVDPRPEYVADLRERLLTAADELLVPGDPLVLPARRTPRERRLVAAASVAVVLAGSTGLAAAAQEALPGETLYPVKRGIERAQAGLSVSDAGKGRDLLAQAQDRLGEVRGLLAQDRQDAAPQVPETLADFTVQAQQGSELLLGSFRDGRDPADVGTVREFTAAAIVALQDLARTAPPEAQDGLVSAALALRDIDEQARALCSSCAADLPDLQLPGIFLTAADVETRLTGVDADALDNSHPVVVDRAGSTGGDEGTGGTGPAVPGVGVPPVAPPSVDPGTGPAQPGELLPDDLTVAEPGTKAGKRAGKKAAEKADGAAKAAEGAAEDIADGLSGVVETILPDPAPGSLLP